MSQYFDNEQERRMFETFEGRTLTSADFKAWPEEKFISLLDFFMEFLDENVVSRFYVKSENVGTIVMKFHKSSEDVYWREFLTRIKVTTPLQFAQRLKYNFNALKKFWWDNPEYLSENIFRSCKRHPVLEDAVQFYKKIKTQNGGEIVVQKGEETDEEGNVIKPGQPVEVIYNNSVHRAASLLRLLVNSISKTDIEKMATDKKFDSAIKLLGALNGLRKSNNKSSIFIGLNVNKAGREDLEGKLLEYTEQQEQSNGN